MTVDPAASGVADERAWNAALDEVEAALREADVLVTAEAATAAQTGDAPVPAPVATTWDPPTDLGPLPEALVPRAQAVLEALSAVAARVAAARDTAGEELAHLAEPHGGRPRPRRHTAWSTEAPTPRHVDHHA